MEKFDKDVLMHILIHDKVMTLASYCLNFDDWKQLGRRLEIADEDLDNIEEQWRQKEYRERVHQMMRIWERKRPNECNLYVLLEALEEIERRYEAQHVIDELVKNGYLKHPQDNGKSEIEECKLQGVVPKTDTSKPKTLLESAVTKCLTDRVDQLSLGNLPPGKWITVKGITYDSQLVLGHGPLKTKIFKGLFEKTEVAIKRIDKLFLTMPHIRYATLSSPSAGHPNLLPCYGMEEDSRYIYMALQPCQKNLASYLSKTSSSKPFGPISKSGGSRFQPSDLLIQITDGLQYLHANGIVHENIKPENILLSDNGGYGRMIVLISDFGIRKIIPGGNTTIHKKSQNPGYTAYEVLLGDQFTFASDIFSLGCIYYYVVTVGKTLFKDDEDVLNRIPELDELSDKNFINYIGRMINRDPAVRPTCRQLQDAPFFGSCPPSWEGAFA